ncbi:MAG: YebC/PmpR family DNA-binding transcriptional regulator [Cyanobacteriota bacterium]|jgi:YebC/PmpR family DNA-binding regulatory protein
MAGHSKWAQIKRTKAVVDAKRGAVFTRLGREITVAARAGGDPAGNFQLRTAIEKARAAGVPNNNIERAIAKGSGQGGAGDQLEAVRYEGYGPGGVAVLIEAFTDNRNRTAADLRLAFSKNGGNLGETGCVGYLFEQRSVVSLEGTDLDEEGLLEALLTLEDRPHGPAVLGYELEGGGAEVWGAFADLEALQDGLRAVGLPVREWEHRWVPQTHCELSDPDQLRACLRMLDALENLDDVRSVTSNLEADEALLEAAAD